MENIENDKRQIGIRIPKELDKRLERHVARIGVSKPAFILQLVYEKLEQVARTQAITG